MVLAIQQQSLQIQNAQVWGTSGNGSGAISGAREFEQEVVWDAGSWECWVGAHLLLQRPHPLLQVKL